MTLQGTLNPKNNLSGKIGIPSQETFERIITAAVDAWLDDHPEATTTVEDGSITNAKLASSFASPGVAAAFSSSSAYAAGDYVFYNGSLYRFTTAHPAGTWTGSDATAVQLANEVNNLKSAFKQQFDNGVVWEQGGLDTSDGTETESTSRIRTNKIYAAKGSKIRPTAGYNNVVYFYAPDGTYFERTTALNVNTPYTTQYDSYIRVTGMNSGGSGDIAPSAAKESWLDLVHPQFVKDSFDVETESYAFLDMIRGGYIVTGGTVGAVVDVTSVTANDQFMYVVFPCHTGDTLWIKDIQGGNGPRAFAILDSDYKVVQTAPSNSTITKDHYAIVKDGYVVINSLSSKAGMKVMLIRAALSDKIARNDAADLQSDVGYQFNALNVADIEFLQGTIGASGIADSSTKIYSKLLWMNEGTTITCNSGFQFSLIGYNALGTLISNSGSSSSKKVVQTAGMYRLLVSRFSGNIVPADAVSAINIKGFGISLPDIFNNVGLLKNAGHELEQFSFDFDVPDVSAEMASIDYSSPNTIMPQIYALFDQLVSNNGSYITKVDIAEELGISYPEYANGVSGSETYLDTPAYKTYMYKFIDTNQYSGNGANGLAEKHRLLIVCGTHGNEIATPFNAYMLAKSLCDPINNANAFKLRSAFDIYIIPCLNGYGMYHLTYVNANGVNINRNYPVKGWTANTEAGDFNTGPTPGSEFETQIVMAATKKIVPNVAIDHHNYGKLKWQFYCLVPTPEIDRVVYRALTECSRAFIKAYPTYFGTKYKLFQDATGAGPKELMRSGNGMTGLWWYEWGVDVPAIVEIGNNINYLAGVYESSAQDLHGATTFAIGNYTLWNVLLHLCQLSLQLY